MRILLYNIAYGTGAPKTFYKQITHIHNFIRTSHRHIHDISNFIKNSGPDITGLVEIDTGSYRTKYINQVDLLSDSINAYHHYSIKYGKRSINRQIPILNKQANAVLTKDKALKTEYLYFPIGTKRLIIKLQFKRFDFYLLHLALKKSVRKEQLNHLIKIINRDKPVIIAGDLNTFAGEQELDGIKSKLNLINPNFEEIPTYPSWAPKHQLDYILCSKSFTVNNAEVINIKHSDHLPIIVDIDINVL